MRTHTRQDTHTHQDTLECQDTHSAAVLSDAHRGGGPWPQAGQETAQVKRGLSAVEGHTGSGGGTPQRQEGRRTFGREQGLQSAQGRALGVLAVTHSVGDVPAEHPPGLLLSVLSPVQHKAKAPVDHLAPARSQRVSGSLPGTNSQGAKVLSSRWPLQTRSEEP